MYQKEDVENRGQRINKKNELVIRAGRQASNSSSSKKKRV